MGIDAFIDRGFSDKHFLRHFLLSTEFTVPTLKKLIPSKKTNQSKDDLVSKIEDALDSKVISAEDILLVYLEYPKSWLSFKLGSHLEEPDLDNPAFILRNFGEEKWYGPIFDKKSNKKWYIRIHKVSNPSYIGIGEARTIDLNQNIRWIVAAEVCSEYVSLHWKGFSYTIREESLRQNQFPYWIHIPKFFDELKDHLKGDWEYPNLYKLILLNLWNKYLDNEVGGFKYQWQHLRIRAEASGVALNARSSGISDIDIRGLQALSKQLAKSAIESLGLDNSEDSEKFSDVENAILRTLIQEWGTKSYEFCLDGIDISSGNELSKKERIFKAHCYFGAKPNSKTPDVFIHLNCFLEYGGSHSALGFLINELGLGVKK